jgi:pfkB family carbohydrate kinase
MTIVTVTLNPAVDVCASAPWIEPGRKLHGTGAGTSPGGGGVNVARAIHRLGGQATAVFPAGGSTGALLCELLHAEGVPIRAVAAAGITREDFAVTEVMTRRLYRFVLPGPTLAADELGRCVSEMLHRLTPGSMVVISGSLRTGVEPGQLAAMADAARARGPSWTRQAPLYAPPPRPACSCSSRASTSCRGKPAVRSDPSARSPPPPDSYSTPARTTPCRCPSPPRAPSSSGRTNPL